MIDQKDFERLVPRYSDNETSAGETKSIRQFLLTDIESQADLERVELEGEWLSRAFARPVEDISRVVIKIRARNPHRPTYVSPLLMILAQLVTLAGLGFAIFLQTGDLIPPRVTVAGRDGDVMLGQDLLAEARGLVPLNSPVSVGKKGSLTLQIGAADSITLAPQTTLEVQSPRVGVRHVARLTSGEIWGRLVDSQTPFVLSLPGGAEIQGDRFELNVVAGPAAASLLPRKATFTGKPEAVIRVMEGVATVRLGDDSQALRPGSVLVTSGGEITELIDPDAAHYRALRQTPAGEFRHTWNWLAKDRLPLSREVATYQLWKSIRDFEEQLSAARSAALHRDHSAEIAAFRSSITRALEAARDWERRKPKVNGANGATSNGDTGAFTILSTSPEAVANRASLLHLPPATPSEPGPEVLLAFSSEVERLFQRWDAGELDLVALTSSTTITNVHRALANMLSDVEQNARRVDVQLAALKSRRDSLNVERDSYLEATALVATRASAEARDPDGVLRDKLLTEIEEQEEVIRSLEEKAREAEFVRVQAAPLLAKVDSLNQQLASPQRELTRLMDQRRGIQERLDANTFRDEQLQAATAEVNVVVERLSGLRGQESARTAERVRAAELASKSREATAKAAKALSSATELRDARAEELSSATLTSQTADTDLDLATEALAVAQAAHDALPEDQRKDSAEAAALAAALLAHQQAQAAAATAAAAVPPAREKLASAESALVLATKQHEEAVAAQSGTDMALAEAEARLQSLLREISDAERHLEEVKKIEADLQKAKIERAGIVSELAAVDAKIAPLSAQVAELNQRLAEEREKLRPVQEQLDELTKEANQLPDARKQLAELNRRYDSHESTERLLLEARLAAMHSQTRLLVAWDGVLERAGLLAGALGSGARAVPVEATELRQKRADLISEIEPDGSWRPGLEGDPIAEATRLGDVVTSAYQRHLDRELELNDLSLLRRRARLLSLSWLRAMASASEERALAEDDRKVAEYRELRDHITGFQEMDSPKLGTVYALLLSEARRHGTPSPDGYEIDTLRQLFQAMWKLYASTDISSERERRRESLEASVRASTLPARSGLPGYLSILTVDPASTALTNVHSTWSAERTRIVGEE